MRRQFPLNGEHHAEPAPVRAAPRSEPRIRRRRDRRGRQRPLRTPPSPRNGTLRTSLRRRAHGRRHLVAQPLSRRASRRAERAALRLHLLRRTRGRVGLDRDPGIAAGGTVLRTAFRRALRTAPGHRARDLGRRRELRRADAAMDGHDEHGAMRHGAFPRLRGRRPLCAQQARPPRDRRVRGRMHPHRRVAPGARLLRRQARRRDRNGLFRDPIDPGDREAGRPRHGLPTDAAVHRPCRSRPKSSRPCARTGPQCGRAWSRRLPPTRRCR